MDKAESWLFSKLEYRFDDAALLRQALTHRSATSVNNERLEFLGDAVLDFVISEAVFDARPSAHAKEQQSAVYGVTGDKGVSIPDDRRGA